MKNIEARSSKERLLCGTVLPLVFGIGIAIGGFGVGASGPAVAAERLTSIAGMRTVVSSNPAAAARARPVQLAACKAKCGACGACKAKCGACGACKAKCGACGGCGACGPCSAGGAVSKACVVPRLQKAAAKRGACKAKCGACKAKCGACGACKAKCAAAKCGACGACKAKCGACKAKCGACGACGASAGAELDNCEAAQAYKCLTPELTTAYSKAGLKAVKSYNKWKRFNTVAYQSATHGSRYVNNYTNGKGAKAYGKFEKIGKAPKGLVTAKDSFQAMPDGKLALGPLFIMEKMGKGFNKASWDWRYSMVMPDGSVMGTTGGKGSANMKFCYECHNAMGEEADALTFLPKEYRK